MMRSKLFVPAIRPELYEKALRSGADAVCFDLEDAVAADRKQEARQHLRDFLSTRELSAQPLLIVRTNAVGSDEFRRDIEAIVWPSVYAIALPKVESAEEISAAGELLAGVESVRGLAAPIAILPTIESARGLRLAAEIAVSSPRVIGLQVGFADLLLSTGISAENLAARNQIRLMLRLAAAEANLNCYDSAFAHIEDVAGYEAELQAARGLGFAGSSCVHPKQVAVANRVFMATKEEIAQAQRVVDAAQRAAVEGHAVVLLDGKMIDRPFVLRAKQVLGLQR